jgi:phage tail sheath gpL-like
MLSRFGGERQIDGVVCSAGYGSVGTLTTLGNARNSAHVSIMDAATSPSAVWIWAAEYAALVAAHYSTPSTGLTGGSYAMNVKGPVRASRRKRDERNTLLYEGIATHVTDNSGRVYIDRAITTYQTNAQSVPDVSYLKVETMQQLSNIRKDLVSSTMRDFEGFMKSDNDNDIPPGMRVATPKGMTLHRLSRFEYWRSQGWCQGSSAAFLAGYTIETDATDVNRFRDQMAPHLMNQMFGVSGRISFVLQQLFAQAA